MAVQNDWNQYIYPAALLTVGSVVAGVLIGPPVGAIGGALFGASRAASGAPLNHYSERALTPVNQGPDRILATIATIAIQLIGSVAAAWAVLALAGFSVTFSQVVILAVASIVIGGIAGSLYNCMKTVARQPAPNPVG